MALADTMTHTTTDPAAPYPDLRAHLATLERQGLVVRVDRPINKDTQLHPLVRWQFRGGLQESDRKAFLFTNVVDARGRTFRFPVLVGALAASAEIYRLGIGAKTLAEIEAIWTRALAKPIPPRVVERAPCQEVVLLGDDLRGEGNGLDRLPVPVSTPGYDAAPYLTATNVITRDPDTGIQNMGTYRGALKAPDRLGVMLSPVSGGRAHWFKYKARGERMPVAFVVGAPPVVAYTGPQKLHPDIDELAISGGLAGAPINVVRGKTVDLLVPAEAEFVIEGLIRTDELEPEGPFGESHGYIALEEFNFILDVTAITHRREPIFLSVISQVTPSESSVVKRVAYEPLFLTFLRDQLGIKGVIRVSLHEPLTNLRPVIIIQFAEDVPSTEIWRALRGAMSFQLFCGKIIVAVNDDIDPRNGDALLWALAYRSSPHLDTRVVSSSRARAWAAQRYAQRGRLIAADRRHPQGPDAAARAAETGVHGRRQADLGEPRFAAAVAAAALARLPDGDLERGLGRGRRPRGRGPLCGQRRAHRANAGARTWAPPLRSTIRIVDLDIMKPAPFTYHDPRTMPDALTLLAELDNAKVLAGGQSLMPMMNMRYAMPDHLVDLNQVEGLAGISKQNDRLRIGAMTRQRDLETFGRPRLRLSADAGSAAPCRSPPDPQPRHHRRQPVPPRSRRRTAGGMSRCRREPACRWRRRRAPDCHGGFCARLHDAGDWAA